MINEYIPDVAVYINTWIELGKALESKSSIEYALDALRAMITKEALSNPVYFVNGKPPSMEYVKSVYFITGLNPENSAEIQKMILELASLEATIKRLNGIIKSEDMKMSVFQTLSANARNVVAINE